MAVATILASAVHQPLDRALGEIASLDCQVYDGWSAFLGCRFHADKPCLRVFHCIGYTLFLHSRLLPFGGVLSSVGSRGGTGCETPRVHIAARPRSGRLASGSCPTGENGSSDRRRRDEGFQLKVFAMFQDELQRPSGCVVSADISGSVSVPHLQSSSAQPPARSFGI